MLGLGSQGSRRTCEGEGIPDDGTLPPVTAGWSRASVLGQLGAPDTALWLLVTVATLLALLGVALVALAVLVVRHGGRSVELPVERSVAQRDGRRLPANPLANPLGVPIGPRRSPPPRDVPASVVLMADAFDPSAMLERFKFRAQAVKNRPMPPIEGPGREEFKQQAKLDFMDYSILADGTARLEDGILTITVDLRPPSS